MSEFAPYDNSTTYTSSKPKQTGPEPFPYEMFFTKPWLFWILFLSSSVKGSLVGTAILITVLVALYYLLPKGFTWWGIGLFLTWVGPIIFFLPFVFLFTFPALFRGDLNLPVGCGRDKVTGELICV